MREAPHHVLLGRRCRCFLVSAHLPAGVTHLRFQWKLWVTCKPSCPQNAGKVFVGLKACKQHWSPMIPSCLPARKDTIDRQVFNPRPCCAPQGDLLRIMAVVILRGSGEFLAPCKLTVRGNVSLKHSVYQGKRKERWEWGVTTGLVCWVSYCHLGSPCQGHLLGTCYSLAPQSSLNLGQNGQTWAMRSALHLASSCGDSSGEAERGHKLLSGGTSVLHDQCVK